MRTWSTTDRFDPIDLVPRRDRAAWDREDDRATFHERALLLAVICAMVGLVVGYAGAALTTWTAAVQVALHAVVR